jgi:hypothetical protein
MANNFEQSMAALAENRIAAEHSNLVPYRQGFVLLDFDEQEAKAFGIYRFVVGNIPCMMPVVIRNGEVDGLDILIVRDIKLFVPAVDGWISMISSLGSREIGELLPKKDKSARGPSQIQIRTQDFPYMLKTAATELSTAEYSALVSGLTPPAYDKVAAMLTESAAAKFIPTSVSASYLVAKAASDADFHDRFISCFSQDLLNKARLSSSVLVQTSVLKLANSEPGQVHVITDIGDPLAASLTPNQKRALLKTGQFIVDHRAEAETATVYASPDSLCLRTNPSPGRWDVLTNDGRLVPCTVAYNGTDVPGFIPNHGLNVGLGSKKNQQVSYILVPLHGNGYMDIKEGRQIFCRPSKVQEEEWAGKGKPATTATVAELAKAKKAEDSKCCGPVPESGTYVSFLVIANGIATGLEVEVDTENPEAMKRCGVPVVFSDRFRSLKMNEHCIYIPDTAIIYSQDKENSGAFVPGTPSDLDLRIKHETGTKDLKVNLRGNSVQVSGAINHAAMSENDAVRALVFEAQINAEQAYGMVRKAATMPDKECKYLWKCAGPDVGPIDTATIHNEPATTTYTPADVNRLNEATPTVVGTAKKKTPDDVFTKDMLQSILQMTDFREISSDTLQALSAAMNEAGRLLLRILVHMDEYQERYGEDDTERLQTTCQKQFTGNGDMVLFLREKRGASGQSDNESLMGLLSEDMG